MLLKNTKTGDIYTLVSCGVKEQDNSLYLIVYDSSKHIKLIIEEIEDIIVLEKIKVLNE